MEVVEVDEGTTEGVERSKDRVLGRVSYYACRQRTKLKVAHRSGGRLEGLRLAACITADSTDSSILWASKTEEIDSSKEVGSSMSAGTRFFKTSTMRVGLEVGVWVEVEAGRAGMGSRSVDIARRGGVLNLTVGFVYGFGRLFAKLLEPASRCQGRNSRISIRMSFPHNQTSVLLNTITAERKSLAGNELDKAGSAAGRGLPKADTHLGSDPRATEPTRRGKINNRWILSVALAVAHISDAKRLNGWMGWRVEDISRRGSFYTIRCGSALREALRSRRTRSQSQRLSKVRATPTKWTHRFHADRGLG
jgi:hypothetical protein